MEPNPSIPWNIKGKNGITCFFSEETYSRFLGKETFESRLQQNLKKVGITIPPLLDLEPKPPDAATSRAETGAEVKDEGEKEGIGQSVEEPGVSTPRKRKSKKQSKRKLKGESASQNDLKPELEGKSADLVEGKLKDGSENENKAWLENESGQNTVGENINVSDMMQRAREYALTKTEQKNACGTDREQKREDLAKESQSCHAKEDNGVYKNTTELHIVKPDDITGISESVKETVNSEDLAGKSKQVTQSHTDTSSKDIETLNTTAIADKSKQTSQAHTDAPEKDNETTINTVIPETESDGAGKKSIEDEKQIEKSPTITNDNKASSKPKEKVIETLDEILRETNRTSDENVSSMKHSEVVKGDDHVGRGTSESESSSDEDGDKSRGYGKQRRLEKERSFTERKRNAPQRRDIRSMYDRKGEYIPAISTMNTRRRSELLYLEQNRFLSLSHKYRQGYPNYPTKGQIKEIEELKGLEVRVQDEQKEYNEYLKKLYEGCAEDYEYIHPDVKRYVDEKLSHVLPRVNQYPRYYNLQEKISLVVPTQQPSPVLQFIRPLLELGVVPKAVLPNMLPNAPLPATGRSYIQVNENYPATRPTVKGQHVWNHEPCSKDSNAEELGMRHGINIVMSAAALKCLVDTQDEAWGKHWELPVTVKEYDVFDGKKKLKHKVAYLDKPVYLSGSLSVRDRNIIFYKNALKNLIIRTKQKGHVFTNIKPQHVVEPTIPHIENVRFQNIEGREKLRAGSETPRAGSETPRAGSETPRAGSETPRSGSGTPRGGSETRNTESESPRADKETTETEFHVDQQDENNESKTKDTSNVADQSTEQTKRTAAGRAKPSTHTKRRSKEKDETLENAAENMEDEQISKSQGENMMLSEDLPETNVPEKHKMEKNIGKGKKTVGGMFDVDTGVIEDIETFGMEKSWKSMLKEKHQPSTSQGEKKHRAGHHTDEAAELEKLKSELKGLESKAKKETEKVHSLGITTPPGKFYSSAAKKPSISVSSFTPKGDEKMDSHDISKTGTTDTTHPVNASTESTLKSHKAENKLKICGIEKQTSKVAVSKQVLNLNTVETLTSSGMRMSNQMNLRSRGNAVKETAGTSAPSDSKTVNKEEEIKSSATTASENKSKSLQPVEPRPETVKNDDLVQKDEVAFDDNTTDDSNDEDDGLVIDVPDTPVTAAAKSKSSKQNQGRSTTTSPFQTQLAPISPPASPQPPASPPAPESPPLSPPASPVMDNPASPINEGPVSPDKTGTPRGLGLRNTCVVIPLGDDDQNVIDHSINATDNIIKHEGLVKKEVKPENPSYKKEIEIQNFEKLLMNPAPIKPAESTKITDASASSSHVQHVPYKQQCKENKPELKTGSNSVTRRRSSLRSAAKDSESSGQHQEKEIVQTRRNTRLSSARQSAENEQEAMDTSKEDRSAHGGQKNSEEGKCVTEQSLEEQEEEGPWTRRKHSGIALRNKQLKDTMRQTRSRSSSHDKTENVRASSVPDRRVTRHSLESVPSRASTPDEDLDIPVMHKKRKTNVIESDEEDDDTTMDTSQSVKTKIAEQFQSEVVAKQRGRRGRPTKVKKPQKSQDTSEADKIKELAEKLKKQMKEKQEKLGQCEAQKSNVNKTGSDGGPEVSMDSISSTKDSPHGDGTCGGDAVTVKSHKAKDHNGTAHVRKQNATEISHNQKTVGHKTGTDSISVQMSHDKHLVRHSTEAPVAGISSNKAGDSTNIDSLLNLQSEMLKPSGAEFSPDSFTTKSGMSNLAFPVSGNVIYSQWNLQGINIMIRCSHHGNIKDSTHKNSYVYVTPKLEYQPVYGVEQETVSEIARNWISVYVRPTCTLLRARVNVFTSEILLLEEMNFQSLLPPNTAFNQFKAFGQLHNVCHKLKGLEVGSYLLTHSPGDEEITLMKSTEGNKRGAYDLHFRHTNMMGDSRPAPRQWLPIDPNIITMQHRRQRRIPLTFQPKDIHMARKIGAKNRKKKKQRLEEL